MNEASGDFTKFQRALSDLEKWLDRMSMDGEWVKKHTGIDKLRKAIQQFRQNTGPKDETNVNSMKTIVETMQVEPWKAESQTGDLNKLLKSLNEGWIEWGGQKDIGKSNDSSTSSGKLGEGKYAKGWHPNMAYKIDIRTNFNDDWYKRTYKSGLINAAIRAIKTDARSHSSPDVKTKWTNHEYTYDEMLPQEKKQLDGIQWKMTNNVARDYIQFLLGWTREKEMNDKGMPTQELQFDQSFGKKMADSALSDRGFLGRLRQKLFAGGQANNVVSVLFQTADPEDGWEVVEGSADDGKDAPDEGGDGEGDSSSSTSPSDTTSTPSPKSMEERVKKIEDVMTDNGLWKEGSRVSAERRNLILETCANSDSVGKLVDSFILGNN